MFNKVVEIRLLLLFSSYWDNAPSGTEPASQLEKFLKVSRERNSWSDYNTSPEIIAGTPYTITGKVPAVIPLGISTNIPPQTFLSIYPVIHTRNPFEIHQVFLLRLLKECSWDSFRSFWWNQGSLVGILQVTPAGNPQEILFGNIQGIDKMIGTGKMFTFQKMFH